MRKTIFANEEYYHIYNRGTDKREIFLEDFDYVRFLKSMREFNTIDPIGSLYEKNFKDKQIVTSEKNLGTKSPIGDLVPNDESLVDIITYCLNPNHFHLILKQKTDKGISKFMLKLGSGYSSYFNKKYNRSGSLFQGPFKAIHIDTNEYLLHLSVYVNRNNFIHGYENKEAKSPIRDLAPDLWQYSSYPDYIGQRDGKMCNKEVILGQFKNQKEYVGFMEKTALYLKDKKELKRYLLE
ncbi:MAG: transposase [Candidatus Moraniibacteriota bacterium]